MSQFVNFSDEALRPVFILSALRNICPETLSCRGDPVSEFDYHLLMIMRQFLGEFVRSSPSMSAGRSAAKQ
jgi:hypothetical protein